MISNIGLLLVFLAYLAFCTKRTMTYLHIFQQEEYDNFRFLQWLATKRVFDKKLSLLLLVTGFLWFGFPAGILFLVLFLCFAVIAALEADPRTVSKKKLVMTQRAQRILVVTLCLMALIGVWWFVLPLPWLWILTVQLLPFVMLVANTGLQPFENHIQKKFWNEANRKLSKLSPTVIGITGSFGKTSVKHILGHILKTQAPTLITPGSVNTPMGVTRIIREQLDESHKYFIVEMGAYGPGSIERLCRLTPPDMGLITAIGHAHYERFRSLETVVEAKFELAEAVLQRHGKVIAHDSCLRFPYSRAIADKNRGNFVICGEAATDDLHVTQVLQMPGGLRVEIVWQHATYTLTVPLFGAHHGYNAALAFAAAAALHIPPENIVTALKSVPQIQHRLEVKKQSDGTTIIDDAFNSNPMGFRSALEALAVLDGRKILITPGMVELGEAHEGEHEKIGERAGEVCDIALVVRPGRIPSFIHGFKKTGNGKNLVEVQSFREAWAWLEKEKRSGDIILIENDLPDLYETLPKI